MSALVARLRPQWDAVAGYAAEAAGHVVGKLGRSLPGIAGPLLIAYGLYEVYRPLGFITLGVFLLLLDRRV